MAKQRSTRVRARRVGVVAAGLAVVGLTWAGMSVASWRPRTQKVLTDQVAALQISPDGRTLVSVSEVAHVRFVDANTLKGKRHYKLSMAYPPFTFSRDLTRLAGTNRAMTKSNVYVAVWNAVTGKRLASESIGHNLSTMSFAADGTRLGAGAFHTGGAFWQTWRVESSPTRLVEDSPDIETKTSFVSSAFAPDGSYTVTGGYFGEVKVWSPGHKLIRKLSAPETVILRDGERRAIYSVAISPDSRVIAANRGHRLSSIHLWNASTGKRFCIIANLNEPVTSLVFSPDNQLIAGAIRERITLWNMKTGTVKRTFQLPNKRVSALAWFPDGNTLASGHADGTIALWRIR